MYFIPTMEYESYFDIKLRINGNSHIITIPSDTIDKLKLKEGEILEVGIRRYKKQ